MPWPSEMTAQVTGMYGQHYQQMGMMVPSSMLAEQMMGGGMSRGMASGGPMMQGAAAMMGFDPMSMGIRAAQFGWNRGAGVMGAGMMGLGAAAGVGAVGMGVHFAGSQMMQGAQNQMAFNNSMRQNFNFMRGDGAGQGFSRQDMGAISSTLQSMTGQYGPGGEVSTFGELSRLASNMGKMGMTDGVRDAKEFSRKFKEMVTTLKTVATELGTSLESAQELLSSARGSGIFKTGDQLKFSSTMRTTGLAGNLATSEMTAMANIGSRISRQFGGLGGAGAMGGIKALGQVGTATQIGALSEEDIYNATGMTGAEGRQAMASEMMQNTGNFLRTGKGRYFLASVAGKNGQLNMDAANEYMYGGGMGTDRTKQLAQENLRGVGRANFIRNEGRLRGQVMEQFGGLAPAIALSGWAQQRGININDMDDRSMLFAQRQLGMGRDELDATVKMAQNLPSIMSEQRRVARSDEYNQGRAQYSKSRDIRTRLDHVREGIQGKLQQIGADLFQEGSDFIESTMNRIMGQYETFASRNLDEIGRGAKMGGAGNMGKFNDMIGNQAGLMGMSSKQISAAADQVRGRGGFSGGDPSKMQEALRLREMASAANFGGADQSVLDYASKNQSSLLQSYAGGIAGKRGDDRVAAVRSNLEAAAKRGDPNAQKVLTQMKTNPQSAAAIVGAMERQIGLDKEAGLGASYGKGEMFASRGGYASERDQNFAMGGLFSGRTDMETVEQAGLGAQSMVAAKILGGTAVNMATAFGEMARYAVTGKGDNEGAYAKRKEALTAEAYRGTALSSDAGKMQEAIGAAFRDPASKAMIRSLATGKDADDAYRRMSTLQAKGKDITAPEKGELAALKATQFGKRYADLKRSGDKAGIAALLKEAGEDPTIAELTQGMGMSEGVLEKFGNNVAGVMGEQARIDRSKLGEQWAVTAGKDLEGMKKMGLLELKDGKWNLSSKTLKSLPAGGGQAANLAVDLLNRQSRLAGMSDEDRLKSMNMIAQDYGKLTDQIAGMSIEDKRKFAKSMAGTEASDMALEAIGQQQKFQGLSKATHGDVGATAARFLGLNLGKEKEALLKGKSTQEITEILSKTVGAEGSTGFKSDLQKALDAAKSGKPEAGMLLTKAIQGADDKVKQNIARASKEQEDPLQADIARSSKLMTRYLEAIAKGGDQQKAILAQIAAEGNKDNPDKK